MRSIDYNILVENCEDIINTLEHDSMRSSGKMKMNSDQILALYKLLPIYKEKVVKQKPTPKKKEG
jgi:hypothetical protein